MNRTLFLVLAAALGISACSKSDEPAAQAKPTPQVRSFEAAPNSGKIVQVQQAGTYTYAEVETGQGQRIWIAGGHIEAKPGDNLQWGEYSVMRNFNAKSLGRTFEQILFVSNWGLAGGPTAEVAKHGAMPGAVAPVPQQAGAADSGNSGIVKSVANAGGYSYVEVDQGGKIVWVAAPETKVKAGDKVSWQGGSEMQNFNAKSLNRVFERIIFAGGITVGN